MSIDVGKEEILALAEMLAAVGALYDPKKAAALALLFKTGVQVADLIGKVREQTESNQQQVWDEVQSKFALSVEGFQASLPVPKE